jgi:hypothetical protein
MSDDAMDELKQKAIDALKALNDYYFANWQFEEIIEVNKMIDKLKELS